MEKIHIPSSKMFHWIIATLWCAELAQAGGGAMSGALFSNAQYNQQYSACEATKLMRCQQDVLRDMAISVSSPSSFSSADLTAAGSPYGGSIKYPINGPPYSPIQKQQQLQLQAHSLADRNSICRSVRSNLNCLLNYTPACYDSGYQSAQNTDFILRAKRYLEQNGCNEPDLTWQNTFCFRSTEVKNCEDRYGFNLGPGLSNMSNQTACLAYNAFKLCVESHVRLNCKVSDMDMTNEYLIDRASDLSWRCPHNSSYVVDPYRINNQPATSLLPLTLPNGNSYDQQRPLTPYYGSSGNSHSYDRAWERFPNPDSVSVGRYPGDMFDRLVAGDLAESDCPVKASPYTRECQSTMEMQRRVAASSRDGNELERRVCCALYQFRDCISRVVLDRCADSTTAAVDFLMGTHRRDLSLGCKYISRDVCSGAAAKLAMENLPVMLTAAIISAFVMLKQSILGVTTI